MSLQQVWLASRPSPARSVRIDDDRHSRPEPAGLRPIQENAVAQVASGPAPLRIRAHWGIVLAAIASPALWVAIGLMGALLL
jgi:hypothetical protein